MASIFSASLYLDLNENYFIIDSAIYAAKDVTALDKLDNLFFEFVYVRAKGEVFAISADSSILGAENYALRYARSVVALCGNTGRKMTVSLELKIPASVKEHYQALSVHASDCIGCRECETRCPFGVKIGDRMELAAKLF